MASLSERQFTEEALSYNSHDENKAARYRRDTTSLAALNERPRKPSQLPFDDLDMKHRCFFCPEGEETVVNGAFLEEERFVYVAEGAVGNSEPFLNAVCRPCADTSPFCEVFRLPLGRTKRPKSGK
ncbi:MAG: hypothetical protein HZB70_03375 [Candidatus Berkelbacteria bacterium]|nr:MAG: hypothetical protein HZB70_03375 [Candidatus Berkelbacteria bacterium]QQG51657.1 MAG: hypothetical protein HY845_03815 [Candidatus Berkelbacteria bacterium]